MSEREAPMNPADVPEAERWALVAEARATFGPLAARQLAERLGMVREGERRSGVVDF